MKSRRITLLILGMFLARTGLAQQTTPTQIDQLVSSSIATNRQASPARDVIAAARKQLEADPKRLQAFNDLALGFVRLARETADPSYLKDAESALDQALKLDPQDFQLLRTRVAVLLAQHDFIAAKKLATSLNHRTPDDVMTYGYLAEADIAQGNYAEAEENAQWMMNLRPNNTPALLVGAKLRTLFGDGRGAIEFLDQAYSQTSPLEVEELAWIANQIASIQIESGEYEAAEQALQRAEKLFAHYPYTTENLARVRMAQNRPGEAVQLLLQAIALDHDPHNLYELGQAQEAAGQSADARVTLANFEKLAGSATDLSTIDLILLHARNAATAPDALRLAQLQVGLKQDVWTMDAYAWALYANAKYEDADAAVQKAMAVGIKSAQLFDHAGHIAAKLDHRAEADRYYELAVRSNPSSKFAADARMAMNSTNAAGAKGQIVQPGQVAGLTLPSNAPRDRLIDSASAAQDAPSGGPSTPRAVPAFAPVAE
ncbi:MAG: tetratricopeptide repeat protein [Terracidiphilus sp.]